MGIFTIDKAVHRIIETDFVRMLRRELRDPYLFTAINLETGEWFLAYWVNRDKGLANDIEHLGIDFSGATRKLVHELRASRKGITGADIKKRFAQVSKRRYEIEVEEGNEYDEMQNWLQKKSGSPVPIMVG